MTTPVRPVLGAAALLLAATLCAAHPVARVPLALGLVALAALLWRHTAAWLVAVPALLPLLDLSPFTGWLLVGEMDLVLLVTLGILLLRDPPEMADLPADRASRLVLAAFLATTMLGLILGLLRPAPEAGTINVLLSPWNALRVAKAPLLALALAPFLWRRQRLRGDALVLFGHGLLLGLVGLSALVMLERAAFPGLWNFASEYRVSASFASMHVGGGHIGAYLAMALPFLLVPVLAPRRLGFPLVLLAGAGGAYALVVTFARTAYAAALAGLAVAAAGLAIASWRARQTTQTRAAGRLLPALAGIAVVGVIGLVIALSAREGSFMATRLERLAPDYAERARNWTQGLALRDDSPATILLGMGTGTYPRTAFTQAPGRTGPSNLALLAEDNAPALRLTSRGPFYLGQKIGAAPGETLRVSLRLRAPEGAVPVSFGICEKWLLYSEACATAGHRSTGGGAWESVSLPLRVPGAPRPVPRPLEFWVHAPPGTVVDLAGATLTGPGGEDRLRNGAFRAGMDHWLITDDSHGSWRIFNQYFTSFFEGGLLGLGAFVALLVMAGMRSAQALWQGERLAACLLGALAAFAVSCLFDAQLEAPAVALLFYLVAVGALSPQSEGVGQTDNPEDDKNNFQNNYRYLR